MPGGGVAAPGTMIEEGQMVHVRIMAGMAGIVAVTLFLLLVQLASLIPPASIIAG
jgi:hypothetical protein